MDHTKTGGKAGSTTTSGSAADQVARDSVARLEKRIMATSGNVDSALDKVQDEMSSGKAASGAWVSSDAQGVPPTAATHRLDSNGAGIWHGDDDAADAPWTPAAAGNDAGGVAWTPAAGEGKGKESGTRLYPQEVLQADGELTGVYDCRGEALTVGALVGRMVKGQPCEDRIMVATAGEWKVTSFKQPSEAELDSLRSGATPTGRVAVVMHGVTAEVNKGTRVETLPLLGEMTSWKVVHGEAADIFLPANIAVLKAKGQHNKAGSPGAWEAAAELASSGASGAQLESAFEAARSNDWGRTGVTEKEDANLDICPGPTCPQDAPPIRGTLNPQP
ncbi:hypothetical protein T484DRAFT_2389759 [Baffinella frigidus]|nr:hypothetical protein T484DRAFT_2389759 [Cryptophyta sp. CCMP2293]